MTEDEVTVTTCNFCDVVLDDDGFLTMSSGELACYDCACVCEQCSDTVNRDEVTWCDDYAYCQNCTVHYLFYCDGCDLYYHENGTSRGTVGDSDGTYCEHCISSGASWCDNCDQYEWDNELCDQDDPEESEVLIHPYGYKPDPEFKGTDKNGVYLGWELEAQAQGTHLRECAEYAYRMERDFDIAYLKSDSSVSNGFEIVTHPFAHNTIRDAHEYWQTIETLRSTYGMRSWDTDCCGLHIHISRAGFNGGAHLHRFLGLVYNNAVMVAKLGGRKSNHFANFGDVWQFNDYGIPVRSFKHKLGRYHSERHAAVNTNNSNTIELRFFKGTLRKQSILAALDFAHAAVEYTRDLRSNDVINDALNWDMFMMWVEDNNGIYPDLYVKGSKIHTVNLDKETREFA